MNKLYIKLGVGDYNLSQFNYLIKGSFHFLLFFHEIISIWKMQREHCVIEETLNLFYFQFEGSFSLIDYAQDCIDEYIPRSHI